jgi:hypothetical protein
LRIFLAMVIWDFFDVLLRQPDFRGSLQESDPDPGHLSTVRPGQRQVGTADTSARLRR